MDWFSAHQLHLQQGPQSIVVSDHTPFPLYINQISTLPPPHILVKTISQITIPTKTLSIVPTTFTRLPINYYYNLIDTQSSTDQNLFVVSLLKIFSTKLPTNLLCSIINISPDHITLPGNRHICELTPLNHNYTAQHTASINKITHVVRSSVTNANWTPLDNENILPHKTHIDQHQLVSFLILSSEF